MLGDLLASRALDAFGGNPSNDVNPLYGAQQVQPDEFYNHILDNFAQEYNSSKEEPYQLKSPASVEAEFQQTYPNFKKPTKPIWLDSQGNDVSSHINSLSDKDRYTTLNTPYSNPGFFKRLTRTGEEELEANRQAGIIPGQNLQANNVQNLVGGRNFQQVQPYAPTPFNTMSDPVAGARLTGFNNTAGNLGNEATSLMGNLQGVPSINANTALAQAQNQRFYQQRSAPIENSIAYQQFQRMYGRLPVIEDAKDAAALDELQRNTQNIPAELKLGLGQTQLATGILGATAPYTYDTARRNAISENVASGWMNPLSPVGLRVNANGTVSQPQLNRETGMSPMLANYAAMSGAFGPGGMHMPGQPIQGKLSTGRTFDYSPPSQGVTAPALMGGLIGNSSLPSLGNYGQSSAPNLTPLKSYPDLSVDYSTGRVYTNDGKDVTAQYMNNPDIAMAAYKQRQESIQEARDAEHTSKKADINAKMAALKAEQAELEHQHIKSGLIPQLYAGTKANLGDTVTEPIINASHAAGYLYGKWGQPLMNKAQNYLIGQ